MSEPKFTPGPWEVKEWTRRDVDVLGFGARVASVAAWADPAQTMADARLIAAAPDLLEVVRGFVAICDGGPVPEGLYATTVLLAQARAALAKVTP